MREKSGEISILPLPPSFLSTGTPDPLLLRRLLCGTVGHGRCRRGEVAPARVHVVRSPQRAAAMAPRLESLAVVRRAYGGYEAARQRVGGRDTSERSWESSGSSPCGRAAPGRRAGRQLWRPYALPWVKAPPRAGTIAGPSLTACTLRRHAGLPRRRAEPLPHG
jgi:hypothetical protein